ncbi:hypothetical protein [Gymnodinialimonas ulvae]|uniref:hypothetical protein n=1 Tax=Gymnodinialimonas ulvae TaxID=3126504 RepID=UPI0030A3550B
MYRFSVVLFALAAPVAAEPSVTRAQFEALIADHALCYHVNGGSCRSGEVYRAAPVAIGPDGIDVQTGFRFAGRTLVLRETLFWEGDRLCLPVDASGLSGAWRQADGTRYVFALDPADALGDAFVTAQREQFTATRVEGYCFGLIEDDADGFAVWSSNGTTDDVRVRLVPLSEGALSFGD